MEASLIEVHYHASDGLRLHVGDEVGLGMAANTMRFAEVVAQHHLDALYAFSPVPSAKCLVCPTEPVDAVGHLVNERVFDGEGSRADEVVRVGDMSVHGDDDGGVEWVGLKGDGDTAGLSDDDV